MNLSKYLYGKNIIENIFLYTLYLSWLIYIFSIFGTFKYNNTLLVQASNYLTSKFASQHSNLAQKHLNELH